MRFVFRADASHSIGTGHVMRVSAIAEEAINRGIKCTFIGKIDGVPWLEKRILELGFEKIICNEADFDLRETEDILILDTYHLPIENQFLHRSNWKLIVLLIDPKTPPYLADLYVHAGLDGSWFNSTGKNFVFGPKWVPFRKSISRIDFSAKSFTRNITIFAGGTDPTNFALIIAKVLANIQEFDSAVFFTQSGEEIENIDVRFKVLPFGSELDLYISNSQLVLTTASTSSLEVIARGIPVGIACVITNQSENYRTLGDLKLAKRIGFKTNDQDAYLDELAIKDLIRNSESQLSLVSQSDKFFDFNGSSRILDTIFALLG